MHLQNKVAIVTGGSRGIGRAICLGLAAQGAKVVVAARTAVDTSVDTTFEKYASGTVHATAQLIQQRGGTAIGTTCDVTQVEDIRRLVGTTLERFGRIDVLVNNAGINPIWRGIEKISASDWQAILDVNLTGVFLCCKHIGGAMVERGAGSIISITSVAGHVGLVRSVPYCATKGGVEMLSKALALDWAKRGVRVNCLAPGYVDTDLTAGLLHHETLSKPFLEHTPMGRFAAPRDMAGAAVFLASDAASYMTGQSLVVDGGWTAH
jgi:NAD(P)-dependent dehydrogenase (short-subunit alcohol dehydrogenase family)